jgi:hypothetical protein
MKHSFDWRIVVVSDGNEKQVLFLQSSQSLSAVEAALAPRIDQSKLLRIENVVALCGATKACPTIYFTFETKGLILLTFRALSPMGGSDHVFRYHFSPKWRISNVRSFLAQYCLFCDEKQFQLLIGGESLDPGQRISQLFTPSHNPEITIKFIEGMFPLVFHFSDAQKSFEHMFRLWFERSADGSAAMNAFARMLPPINGSPFPPWLIKIYHSTNLLLPNDDLEIEAKSQTVFEVSIVSNIIWLRWEMRTPIPIKTETNLTLAQAVRFWRAQMGGTDETDIRIQHNGERIMMGTNLALLETSKEQPIDLLPLKDFRFRVADPERVIELGFAESDTVRDVRRELSKKLKANITSLKGYRCWILLWGMRFHVFAQLEPEDLMRDIDHRRDIEIVATRTVTVRLCGNKSWSCGLPLSAGRERLKAEFQEQFPQYANGHEIRFCQWEGENCFYAVRVQYPMTVPVEVDGRRWKAEFHEEDTVFALESKIEKEFGLGPWYIRSHDTVITNYEVGLCTFQFTSLEGSLSVSKCAPKHSMVPISVDGAKFTVMIFQQSMLLPDLVRAISKYFELSVSISGIESGGKVLRDPEEMVLLSQCREIKLCEGGTAKQKIRLIQSGKLEESARILRLSAKVRELSESYPPTTEFWRNGERIFDDPNRLLSSYTLTPFPIEIRAPSADRVQLARPNCRASPVRPPVPEMVANDSPKRDAVKPPMERPPVREAVPIAAQRPPSRPELAPAPEIVPVDSSPPDAVKPPMKRPPVREVVSIAAQRPPSRPESVPVPEIVAVDSPKRGVVKPPMKRPPVPEIVPIAAQRPPSRPALAPAPEIVRVDAPPPNVTRPSVPDDASVPQSGVAEAHDGLGSVAPVGPMYLFEYEDVQFTLSIPPEGKVIDAKEQIADRYRTIADYVSLLFRGRNLKDESVLVRLRIGTGKITVLIQSVEAILLQSVGCESRIRSAKPANFIDLVNRLHAETGTDVRTCSRCLSFCNYDYDQSFAALRDDDD